MIRIVVCCQADRNKSGRGWHHHSRAPQSPVNGAGGITGCEYDAQSKGSFQSGPLFFGFFRRHTFFAPWTKSRETFVVPTALTTRQQTAGQEMSRLTMGISGAIALVLIS